MSRIALQIALESRRLGLVREGDVSDQKPRDEFGRMKRLSSVVIGKAPLQVSGKPDIALIRRAIALEQIDVEDRVD